MLVILQAICTTFNQVVICKSKCNYTLLCQYNVNILSTFFVKSVNMYNKVNGRPRWDAIVWSLSIFWSVRSWVHKARMCKYSNAVHCNYLALM